MASERARKGLARAAWMDGCRQTTRDAILSETELGLEMLKVKASVACEALTRARAEAIEEAAKVADERAQQRRKALRSDGFDPDHDWDDGIHEAERIATAIRGLLAGEGEGER